jgi:hypothetical protein
MDTWVAAIEARETEDSSCEAEEQGSCEGINGPGVEGLVRAVMFANKIASHDVEGDSEGDACLLYFTNVKTATHVAQLAAAMIKDRTQLAKAIQIAREQGFED